MVVFSPLPLTWNPFVFLPATFSFSLLWSYSSLALVSLSRCLSESAQEARSFGSEAIGDGNTGACVHLIKVTSFFFLSLSLIPVSLPVCCLGPDSLSSSSSVQLKNPTTTQDPLLLPVDFVTGPRSFLEDNHRASLSPLISCPACLLALLTTSSLTLLIYFLTSHITGEFLVP